MTFENTNAEDQSPQVSGSKIDETRVDFESNGEINLEQERISLEINGSELLESQRLNSPEKLDPHICYNTTLDNEIRSRLDKLNALSDLINSLERQFDEANNVFSETLKCSTERLSSIAKTLGNKSIRHGRDYNAAKISVEQKQSECQRACVQFEQANKDHQIAKIAIKEAEQKLRQITGEISVASNSHADNYVDSICMKKLNIHDTNNVELKHGDKKLCDTSSTTVFKDNPKQVEKFTEVFESETLNAQENGTSNGSVPSLPRKNVDTATKLSEELNQAILKLVEAEKKRGQSEQQHLDRASKLMVAQENLLKLEREFGPSIRRTRFYFDEANRFNARLNSVKKDICRISDDINAAKQAYAQTLRELEQFSDDLHDSTS